MAPIFENKKVWLTPTFFQLYAISNSTDFSVGLISEKLNWHKLKNDTTLNQIPQA